MHRAHDSTIVGVVASASPAGWYSGGRLDGVACLGHYALSHRLIVGQLFGRGLNLTMASFGSARCSGVLR